MNLTGISLTELIGGVVGLVLTLLIFSYLLGDNALFRLAIHIFIGVAAAFAFLVAWYNVLWPQLFQPFWSWNRDWKTLILLIVPLLLSVLLLMKVTGRWSGLGSPIMAYLAGIGVAAALGGAILGTFIPQSLASVNLFDHSSLTVAGQINWFELFNAVIILVGTVTTLAAFHFGAKVQSPKSTPQIPKRAGWIETMAKTGQFFIAITFGALFAGIYLASLSALVERSTAVYTAIKMVINLFTSSPQP